MTVMTLFCCCLSSKWISTRSELLFVGSNSTLLLNYNIYNPMMFLSNLADTVTLSFSYLLLKKILILFAWRPDLHFRKYF
jgi:hypothetical protein